MRQREESETKYCDLLLIDEMLPCEFSPFRNLEYAHHLSHFQSSLLLSMEGWHSTFSNLTFEEHLTRSSFPDNVRKKILRFSEFPHIVPKLAYITFLHNVWQVFPYLEDRNIPFILQLYPGGRFELNSSESDERLKAITRSQLCRKIIVTQELSRDYLTHKIGCPRDKIEFIYGGVYETNNGFDFYKDKKLYGRDKKTLDICFVAHRYGNDTKKKGYDQFIAVAKALTPKFDNLRFHVVGDYTPDQIPLGHATERIFFHGKKPQTFFREFYPQMDMILSVNRPDNENGGSFDGFPTGACMEAGFSGVLNCISDPLKMNVAFCDNKDILLLDEDANKTIDRLEKLLLDTDRLYLLAYENWRKFLLVFDKNQQLLERSRIIANELIRSDSLIVRPPARMSTMDSLVFSELKEQLRQATGNHLDAERRHDNLLAEYKKLANGFEQVTSELTHQLKAQTILQDENARISSLLAERAFVEGRLENSLIRLLRTRPAKFLRQLIRAR
ncbi:hypothetical protein [Cupriavidus alkaliphilus]|uniref:hypothetical protein n=1 Tax=Cupriavidus alkaliphilus TaxID=942866 RepID=UPI001618E4E4|nr:hypothetical protein [Cupriavidus alkaliphilus]MBB3011872.1 glycosyltransferase involved in cell wall biosynthesis [Cupriavidus alkaliphilus]